MIKIKIKNFLPPHKIKTANCTAKHNAVQNLSDWGTLCGTVTPDVYSHHDINTTE